jgi:hypothetical protein
MNDAQIGQYFPSLKDFIAGATDDSKNEGFSIVLNDNTNNR